MSASNDVDADGVARLARFLMFGDEHESAEQPSHLELDTESVPAQAFLSTNLVRAVAIMIDNSGILQWDAKWEAEERAGKHEGGRPATFSTRQVLIVLMLLAVLHRPLLLTHVKNLVQHELNNSSLRVLGIRKGEKNNIRYASINRAFSRFTNRIDPFPGPRNRSVTYDEIQTIIASRDPVESERKLLRLRLISNLLIEATIRLVPPHIWSRWDGTACVDATAMPAWGKRGVTTTAKRNLTIKSTPEYDAAWYVRTTEDHSESGQTVKGTKPSAKNLRKASWSFEVTIAVAANPIGEAGPHPLLAIGLSVDKPASRPAQNAMVIVDSILHRGHKLTLLVGDRAYAPSTDVAKLQGPLKSRGIAVVSDYRVDQLGVKEQYAGAIFVEGVAYGPCLPDTLANASVDFREKRISEEVYRTRIEERRRYQLQQKSNPDANGVIAMRCPAAGPSPTVSCVLKPRKGKTPLGMPSLPPTTNLPAEPPKICTNKESVSFGPEHGLKYGQKVPYQTAEWNKLYHSPRNTIEGLNGLLKNDATTAFASPGRRRVRGRTAQTILAAIMIAALNVSKIRSFLRGSASRKPDQPAATKDTAATDGRRRQHTLTDYSASPTSRAGPSRDSL